MAVVGNLEIDIGLKLAKLENDIAIANTKLTQFSRQTENHFSGLTVSAGKFERALTFFTRFGVGAGGLGIVTHLAHLAEKMRDTNPEAERFALALDKLRGSLDSVYSFGFKLLAPDVERIGKAFDFTTAAVKRLNQEFERLKNLTEQKLGLVSAPQSGGVITGREAWKDFDPDMQERLIAQAVKQKEEADKTLNVQKQAREKAMADEREAARRQRDMILDDQRQDREKADDAWVQAEKEATARTLSIDKDAAAIELMIRKDLADKQEKLDQERDDRMKAFTDLWVDNMVEAAQGGFDTIRDTFFRTLEQMALRAAALNLGKQIFPQGLEKGSGGLGGFIGGALGNLGSAFGFAQGGAFTVGGSGGTDSQVVAFRATPGERVSIGNGSGNGQVININNRIDARGADPASAANMARALETNRKHTIAQVKDLIQRGRL